MQTVNLEHLVTVFSMEETDTNPESIRWSGRWPIPKVGEKVVVKMNSLGSGTVTGHFIEKGEKSMYLGVMVKPDNPPDWWVRQNGLRRKDPDSWIPFLVYGAELE